MSFKITLIPVGTSGATTNISVEGDKINYDGTLYDFSLIQNNQQVIAEYPAIGKIKNNNGVYEVSLIFKYNTVSALPDQPASGEDLVFEIESGDVPDPIVYYEEG